MTPIHAWALSTATLRLLTGTGSVPHDWYHWKIDLASIATLERCGLLDASRGTLERITVLGTLDAQALADWALQCLDLEIQPVLVLCEDESLPALTFDDEDLEDSVLTVRITARLRESVDVVREGLANVDAALENWWSEEAPSMLEGYPSLWSACRKNIPRLRLRRQAANDPRVLATASKTARPSSASAVAKRLMPIAGWAMEYEGLALDFFDGGGRPPRYLVKGLPQDRTKFTVLGHELRLEWSEELQMHVVVRLDRAWMNETAALIEEGDLTCLRIS